MGSFSFLSDLKILDVTTNLPGPLSGFLLEELGADVIKVESPAGDVVSNYPELYRILNGNKERMELDLKTGEGKRLMIHLCAHHRISR